MLVVADVQSEQSSRLHILTSIARYDCLELLLAPYAQGKTTMLESQFKKKQRQYFEELGWKFITLEPGGGVPQGLPDTLVISPTGYHCFVEWKKSATAERQPLQDYWNIRLNEMGHDAFFVSPENVLDWREDAIQKSRELSR